MKNEAPRKEGLLFYQAVQVTQSLTLVMVTVTVASVVDSYSF
jgi:hypothetical protein